MSTEHSLGPTCAYHEDETDNPTNDLVNPPKVKAQFFYVSSLPIDDPLSPLPPIQAEKSSKQPPQPFSARDNAALEEAWLAFQKDEALRRETQTNSQPKPIKGVISFPKFSNGTESLSPQSPVLRDVKGYVPSKLTSEHNRPGNQYTAQTNGTTDSKNTEVAANSLANSEGGATNAISSYTLGRTPGVATESQVLLLQSPQNRSSKSHSPMNSEELKCQDPDHDVVPSSRGKRSRRTSPFRRWSRGEKAFQDLAKASPPLSGDAIGYQSDQSTQHMTSDISGRPFARAPSRRKVPTLSTDGATDMAPFSDESDYSRSRSRDRARSSSRSRKKKSKESAKVFVPVGISRLHLVELPDLIMKPIYWSPINDTSNVLRATWFYKETMLPVPVDVANRLEIGYEYMRPYAESYQDELQACIDNGASAELKVVHKLWDEKPLSRPGTAINGKNENGQPQTPPALPESRQNVAADPRESENRRSFETHSVIYIDQKNAQILRPSLLPSVGQNRRPLSSIRKGRQIGIAVVRGFDRKVWLQIHPDPKMDAKAAHAKVGAYMSQSGDATTKGRRMSCSACDNEAKPPKVSDLVLVIHGIGQKLSERVDSFHFTHAINGLRREFNVELSSAAVKGTLRDDSGIMVLPVNWRLTVSFDEDDKTAVNNDINKYQLQDITPDSLHSVRSLISDVMLDIPYYLSHHKDKMTAAVIREANRVYRLWCRNNPGFQENGRVHLIAHSLGSLMALEILSRQPTKLPLGLKLDIPKPSETIFEFNTTNLFCCGSPSGFFLLLNNKNLVPRKGRNKPGMDGEDQSQGIAFEASYGCPALDNIYNICHRNDPISYLLNASVDKDYATSLQAATIPSATTSIFTKVGNTLRWSNPTSDAYTTTSSSTSTTTTTTDKNNPAVRPPMQNMPSTVELETHNFTREEIAEKRMYLLNDNGQIDYYLNSGGGPLEIQYLNMLSAHSSYWILQDFVRFLVVEIGRRPGRENTLPVLRAKKKREFKRGHLA